MSPELYLEKHYKGVYKTLKDSNTHDADLFFFVCSAMSTYRHDHPCYKNDTLSVNKDEYRNLYTTLARAVESGDPLVIGLTVGQVVERLKTLSE